MNSIAENRDCMEAMAQMSDKSFDLCLTDPPFGVRDEEWDSMNEYDFARLSMRWLSEVHRVAKSAVVFCTENSVIETLMRSLYPNVRKCLWHKPLGSQYAGSSEAKLWFSYEVILFGYERSTWEVVKPKEMRVAELLRRAREQAGLSKGGVDMVVRGKKTGLCYRWEEAACIPTPEQVGKLKTFLPLDQEFDDALSSAYADRNDTLEKAAEKAAGKSDVFIYRTVTGGIHPCQKPVELITDLLETFGDGCRSVIDPFLGSGTTRIAAYDVGMEFTGYELDRDYFDAQEQRFANHIAQARLFEPSPTVEQGGLSF